MLKLKRRKNEFLTIYTSDGPIIIRTDKTVYLMVEAPKPVRIVRSAAKVQ